MEFVKRKGGLSMKIKILIVEDQFIEANNLRLILEQACYEVCSIARSVRIALTIIGNEKPDLVLLDIFLQGELTGIDLARQLEERNIAFVFISANSNREILDAAKTTRPYGFLVKPIRKKDVLVMIDVASYLHKQRREALNRKPALPNGAAESLFSAEFKNILGNSEGILELFNSIKIVSGSNSSVLILGESGTGKELVAQAIHRTSARKTKPLVVVNCGALPANLIESELFGHEKGSFTGALSKRTGKFEQAEGGTIFLDEIGELPLDLQVKFLRVLQEKEIESIGGQVKKINVRVLAATNRDLEEEVGAGRFRVDLYYRLNVFPLFVPPLRERKEDILLLADHFLKIYAKETGKTFSGFTSQVRDALMRYNWPGNVRELQNLIERSVLRVEGPLIDALPLPAPPQPEKEDPAGKKRTKTMVENERDHILSVLEQCNWKISGRGGAAEILDLHASTLNSKIKKLGLEKEVAFRRKA
jgi:two-component system response regulator HydG